MRHRQVKHKSKKTPKVKAGKVQRKNFRDVRNSPDKQFFIHVESPRLGYEHFVSQQDIKTFLNILPQKETIMSGLQSICLVDHEHCDGWYEDGNIHICAWEQEMHRVFDALHYDEHKEILAELSIPCEKISGELMHQFDIVDVTDLYEGEIPYHMEKVLCDDWREEFTFDLIHASDFQWQINRGEIELYTAMISEQTIDIYSVDYLCKFTRETIRDYQLLHILLHELGHHQDCTTTPGKGYLIRGEEYAEIYARKYEKSIWDTYFAVFYPN
ncbi:hypothetical protein [Candidatus Uabimicrobium amorphum]|uniref:Uncharacterized protein n=1 Tax=Uabimicrobium amorphum TaxID=2596890 RepID=A0A5S9ISL6_UABAM|nr:hypothetical protein [Candidatus Uabimicrobium amorphum]BBM86866.1 hypothetical protein UABAM_05266 [Candidatus Uabimicrobium amorphum]